MNSRSDFLFIALLMLLGFSPIWTKRVISISEGDFINLNDEKLKYNLPDNILPWDKLNHLKPCCIEDKELPGCSKCEENFAWKFRTKDHRMTFCATIPDPSYGLHDFKVPDDARRLLGARSGPMTRSRDPNEFSGAPSLTGYGEPQVFGNPGEWQSENTPQINVELVVEQNPQQKRLSPQIFPSREESMDSGFLKNIMSNFFNLNQPVNPPVNVTNTNLDQTKQSIIPVDCTIPVDQINPIASDWYSNVGPLDIPMETRQDADDDYAAWNEDNSGYQVVPLPNMDAQNFADNDVEDQSDHNTNINVNTNRISNRRNEEQNKADQEYAKKGAHGLPFSI